MFTRENTTGYTDSELAALNSEWDEIVIEQRQRATGAATAQYWVVAGEDAHGRGVHTYAGPFSAAESYRADRISEAINTAAGYRLTRVVAGGDVNRLGMICNLGVGKHAGRDYPEGN